MKVVLLAAGKSTRLLPLTLKTPKPMLRVGAKPIMEYVLNNFVRKGFKEFLITTHYLSETIMSYFGNGRKYGCKIEYSYENELLNTAGSLKLNENVLQSDFIVCGGHFFLDIDIGDLIRYHQSCAGIATIVFTNTIATGDLCNYGQGIINEDNELTEFFEKPKNIVSNFVHTTYQIFSPEIFSYIPSNTPFSIPDDLIGVLLKKKEPIFAYKTNAKLNNISTPEMYNKLKVNEKHLMILKSKINGTRIN